MKSIPARVVFALTLLAFVFQGYQCGSPEFTGAKVYIQQKNFKEAKRLLEIETQKNPANEEAWYLLGSLRAEDAEYEGMNVAYNAALNLSNKHVREIEAMRYKQWGTHTNLGIEHLNKANDDSAHYYDLSIREFNLAIAAFPDTGITYKYAGYAYSNKGDLDNAIVSFKTAWEKGKDKEALIRVGRIYLLRGIELRKKFESENESPIRAVKNLAEIEKGTRKTDVMRALGGPDNVRKPGRASKREDWVYNAYNLTLTIEGEKVVNKVFKSPYTPAIDSTNYRLAQAEFNNSVRVLEEVKGVDDKDNEALTLLLQAYVESNRIKEAVVTFKKAVENDPANKTNRFILGVLHRTNGDYPEAVKEFKEAITLDPEFADAIYELGATYYNWGVEVLRVAREKGEDTNEYRDLFREALPHFEKVSGMKQDDAQVWETLGIIYAQLGQGDKAKKALDRADEIRKRI